MKNVLTAIHHGFAQWHQNAGLGLRLRVLALEPKAQRVQQAALDFAVEQKINAVNALKTLREKAIDLAIITVADGLRYEVLLTTLLASGFSVTDRDGPYAAKPAFDHAVDMCSRGIYASPTQIYKQFGDSVWEERAIAGTTKIVYRMAGCAAIPGIGIGAAVNTTQYFLRDTFSGGASEKAGPDPAEIPATANRGRLSSGRIPSLETAP